MTIRFEKAITERAGDPLPPVCYICIHPPHTIFFLKATLIGEIDV